MWAAISQILPMILQMFGKKEETPSTVTPPATTPPATTPTTTPATTPKSTGMGGMSGMGSMLGSLVGGMGNKQEPQASNIGGLSQNQFIPPSLMASRQMPSYGNIVQQMLAKQRGF
jgi:predicted lipid-binding transport protein (Tim44 family)